MSNPTSNEIRRSKERIKKTGEIFTPPELVNELLDKLPTELWNIADKTFIDPACGDGNFLVEVIRRKINGGSTPTQALSTTYGVELMADNVAECQRRLLKIAGDTPEHRSIVQHHIVCANTLTFHYWEPTLFDDSITSFTAPQSPQALGTDYTEIIATLFPNDEPSSTQ